MRRLWPWLAWLGALPAAAAPPARAPVLASGLPVERELADAQTDVYRVPAAPGRYFRLRADQLGTDVGLALFGPDGRALLRVNHVPGSAAWEELAWVSDAAGDYRLEVAAIAGEATQGRYRLRLEGPRAPSDRDRRQAAALRQTAEAIASRATQPDAALPRLQAALALWQELADRDQEALVTDQLALLYFENLGGSEKAREHSERAAALFQETGQQARAARTLERIAVLDRQLGQIKRSEEFYAQAIAAWQASGHADAGGHALRLQALIHASQNNYQTAMEERQQAVDWFRRRGNRRQEAFLLLQEADLAYALVRYPEQQEPATRALGLARSIGDLALEAQSLAALGRHGARVNVEGGPEPGAEGFYAQSLDIYRTLNRRPNAATVHNNLCIIHRQLSQFQQALSHCLEGAAFERASGNVASLVLGLNPLGQVYFELGRFAEALDSYDEALRAIEASGYRHTVGMLILNNASRAAVRAGDLERALGYARQTQAVFETWVSRLLRADIRADLIATGQVFFEQSLEVLMELHRRHPEAGYDREALQVSERSRAHGLLRLLAESKAEIREGADAALLAKERGLKEKLNAAAGELSRLTPGARAAGQEVPLKKSLAELTDQLVGVEEQIRFSIPRYAALTRPPPFDVAELQSRLLDDRTILLEFALGKEHSWLWAVTPSSLDSYRLPPQAEIQAAAREVYDLLTARQRRGDGVPAQRQARVAEADARWADAAGRLSRMLLGPLGGRLQREWKGRRLLIVAPGALEYLPFAALPDPEPGPAGPGPLILAHEVVSLPSATVLQALRQERVGRQPPSRAVAVIADPVFDATDPRVAAAARPPGGSQLASLAPPSATEAQAAPKAEADFLQAATSLGLRSEAGGFSRLPFSREEAEAIVSLAPKQATLLATGFQANRATVTGGDLGRHRLVHFATHGVLNSEHPEVSGLVLSLIDERGQPQDGFLRSHEIYNLRLPVEVVVLSACQTALGKEIQGEGLVGLTRGFMYAGAQRVVASVWQVDDESTAELMKRFYRGVLKDGLRPAAALRSAQLELRKQKRWHPPYFWAGFVLQGEWQ